MHRTVRLAGWVLAGCFLAAGCHYKKPALNEWYDQVVVDMDRQDVIAILGRPTIETENEMMYLYDDPEDPARFRFVLDDRKVVIAKYYETKDDLAARAKEVKARKRPVEQAEGEEPGRPYPGGPLPGFETKPHKSPY
jgi:outer membrane protein assembly factor BamE (lipoprotein component of BamABCDE complex)